MTLKNKLITASLEGSTLKIERKSGETTKIPVETIHKVYLNVVKAPFYIWVLYFLIASFSSVITYFFIDSMLSVFVFIFLLFYFNKKKFIRNIYNLCVEFKDKPTYSVKIPYNMKDEIKSLIWSIRAILIKNE